MLYKLKWLSNISLQIRLTVLMLLFVVSISGSMLLIVNRNTTLKITATALPLTKIYASDEAIPAIPFNLSDIPGIVYPSSSFVPKVDQMSAATVVTDNAIIGDSVSPAVSSNAIKLQKASYVLDTTTQDIREYSYAAFGIIILLSGLFVYYFCGRMLRPVKELAVEMQKRTVNTLNQPIENENAVAEVKQLSDAFNHMIENLNHSFEIQKHFNANAAHELRTPIAILQANMEMLEEEENPPIDEYRSFLEISHRTVSRMSHLVESLLQMTQLEQATKTDVIDLFALTKKAVNDAKRFAIEKNVIITYNKPNSNCYIKGNESLFFTAVYNLIENAVKYNNNNGSVNILLTNEENIAEITVTDTGIGIDGAELIAVFQPFYRVDKSRARGLGGAGMGLSLVKNVAELHGGKVCADSKVGVGSVFKITVPLYIAI